MYVGLVKPLETAGKIRVTYNGNELFTRDFAAGETPELRFETPQESGRARALLIIGDKETPVSMASYYFEDVMAGKMLTEDAAELSKKGKSWKARTKLLQAIALLEKIAPDSEELAQAYLSMSFVYFFAKSRKGNIARRKLEGLAWYEKALAVWERNGNADSLRGNLTNVSVMYSRVGDRKMAIARAERGLKMESAITEIKVDSIPAWTHAAARNLEAGNLNRAERIIKDGLKRFGEDTPECAYLWDVRSRVLEARAKQCRDKAEALVPPESCSLS